MQGISSEMVEGECTTLRVVEKEGIDREQVS